MEMKDLNLKAEAVLCFIFYPRLKPGAINYLIMSGFSL